MPKIKEVVIVAGEIAASANVLGKAISPSKLPSASAAATILSSPTKSPAFSRQLPTSVFSSPVKRGARRRLFDDSSNDIPHDNETLAAALQFRNLSFLLGSGAPGVLPQIVTQEETEEVQDPRLNQPFFSNKMRQPKPFEVKATSDTDAFLERIMRVVQNAEQTTPSVAVEKPKISMLEKGDTHLVDNLVQNNTPKVELEGDNDGADVIIFEEDIAVPSTLSEDTLSDLSKQAEAEQNNLPSSPVTPSISQDETPPSTPLLENVHDDLPSTPLRENAHDDPSLTPVPKNVLRDEEENTSFSPLIKTDDKVGDEIFQNAYHPRVADYVDVKKGNQEQLHSGILEVFRLERNKHKMVSSAGLSAFHTVCTLRKTENLSENINIQPELRLVKHDFTGKSEEVVEGEVSRDHVVAQLVDHIQDFSEKFKQEKQEKSQMIASLKSNEISSDTVPEIKKTFNTITQIIQTLSPKSSIDIATGSRAERFKKFHARGATARVLYLTGKRSLIEMVAYSLDYRVREMCIGSHLSYKEKNRFSLNENAKVFDVLSALISDSNFCREQHLMKQFEYIKKLILALEQIVGEELQSVIQNYAAGLMVFMDQFSDNNSIEVLPKHSDILRIYHACMAAAGVETWLTIKSEATLPDSPSISARPSSS